MRRLFLGRRLLPSLAVAFTIGFVFTATYWVSNGFALSGPQIADRDLGRFEHAVVLDVEPGDLGPASVERVIQALRGEGIEESSVRIISNDVRPDLLGGTPTAGPQRVVSFAESERPQSDFPRNYDLLTGRWPRVAGEVVVTPGLRDRLTSETFTAFGGTVQFRVVGTVTEWFDTESTSMLAAPGTWEMIPPATSKTFAPEGAVNVLWSGPVAASRVQSAVRGVLRLAPPADGERPATERTDLVRDRDISLSESQRLLFAYPLALLSAMVGISVVRSNRRWAQAYVRRFREMGLPPRRVQLVILTVLTSGVLVAVAAGVAAGALLGWVLHSWALPQVLTQPVGPMQSLAPVVTAVLVMTGVTLLAYVVDTTLSGTRRKWMTKFFQEMPWGLLRRVLAGLAALRGVQVATRSEVRFDDLGGTGVLITTAFVLLAPDLLALARLCLPRKRPRAFVARRMIDADRGGLALVALIVAASISFPITMNSYNASARRSNDALFTSVVRPDQLWVDGSSGTPGFRQIAAQVSTAVPDTSPIELRFANAFVYPTNNKPYENTGIAVIESADDLIGLLGNEPWVAKMVAYVSTGGVAFLERPASAIHSDDPDATGTLDLPGQAFGPGSSGYAAPFAGVMLEEIANRADLTTVPNAVVFANLTQAETDASILAVRDAGLDTRLLSFYTPTAHTKPTAQSYFALGGLLVLASFLLIGLMRSVGERMRERSGQLLAVGFRRRWSASVAALQLGLAVVAGIVAGVLGSVVSVWVFVTTPDQAMLLDIPTGFIIWTVGLVVAVSAIGIITCVTRVRAQSEADI